MIEIHLPGDIIQGRPGSTVTWEVLERRKQGNCIRYRLKCVQCGFEIEASPRQVERHFLTCTNCDTVDYSKGVAVCRKCGRELPVSAFRERKNCRGGINHSCRECEIKFTKDPEYLANWKENTKICKKCGEVKTPDDFWFYEATADGLMYWCKECVKDYYRDRAAAKGSKKNLEATLEKHYQKELTRKEQSERNRELRASQRIQFNKDRKEFYSNPDNKRKKYLFSKWREGEYNYFK